MSGQDETNALTLAGLRSFRGLSQKAVAARRGITPGALSQVEASADPRTSSIRSAVEAMNGQLHLLAVFAEPDGSFTKRLLRTPGDVRAAEAVLGRDSRDARKGR